MLTCMTACSAVLTVLLPACHSAIQRSSCVGRPVKAVGVGWQDFLIPGGGCWTMLQNFIWDSNIHLKPAGCTGLFEEDTVYCGIAG